MINLDVFMEKTIDYMIGGRLVKVKEPTYDFMSKFAGIGTDENGMEMLYTLLQKYLNNNVSGVKFTLSEVKSWNKAVIQAIINSIAEEKINSDNNPN